MTRLTHDELLCAAIMAGIAMVCAVVALDRLVAR